MLAYIDKLKGVKVISKKSWFLTDDYEAYFSYKNHLFIVYTPFTEVEVTVDKKDTPPQIIKEVLEHAASYNNVSLLHSLVCSFKYFLLPFNAR
jgi:hypothetical protein